MFANGCSWAGLEFLVSSGIENIFLEAITLKPLWEAQTQDPLDYLPKVLDVSTGESAMRFYE
jgi:hypothetical protein